MRRALGYEVDLRELGITPDCFVNTAGAGVLLPDEELRLAREIRALCALSDAYQHVCALPVPQHLIDLVASYALCQGCCR
jgi:hypothetical protein